MANYDASAALAANLQTDQPIKNTITIFREGMFYDRDFSLVYDVGGRRYPLRRGADYQLLGATPFLIGPNRARAYCALVVPMITDGRKYLATFRAVGAELMNIDQQVLAATNAEQGLASIAITQDRVVNGFVKRSVTDFADFNSLLTAPIPATFTLEKKKGSATTQPEFVGYNLPDGSILRKAINNESVQTVVQVDLREFTGTGFAYVEATYSPDAGLTQKKAWVSGPLRAAGDYIEIPAIPVVGEVQYAIRYTGAPTRSAVAVNSYSRYSSDLNRKQFFAYSANLTTALALNAESEVFDLLDCAKIAIGVKQSTAGTASYQLMGSDSVKGDWVPLTTLTTNAIGYFRADLTTVTTRYAKLVCSAVAGGAKNEYVSVTGQAG